MGAKIGIKNVFLNAITYHYCYNLPENEVKKLHIRYRRMLASQAKTKAWCEKSTVDEKLIFFNAIGLNTGLTILPDKVKSGVSLKEILKKYDEEKLSAAQKEQANLGCYVVTDRDTSFLLSLMGMTINHESYLKALEYNKTGFAVKEWTKHIDSPNQMEMFGVIDNAMTVSNTILNAGLSFDVATELFEVNPNELKILLWLYQKRQMYLFRDDIIGHFSGYISHQRALRAVKKLILNEYLDKHQEWQTYRYRISSKGLTLVGDFINRILKQNQF